MPIDFTLLPYKKCDAYHLTVSALNLTIDFQKIILTLATGT